MRLDSNGVFLFYVEIRATGQNATKLWHLCNLLSNILWHYCTQALALSVNFEAHRLSIQNRSRHTLAKYPQAFLYNTFLSGPTVNNPHPVVGTYQTLAMVSLGYASTRTHSLILRAHYRYALPAPPRSIWLSERAYLRSSVYHLGFARHVEGE